MAPRPQFTGMTAGISYDCQQVGRRKKGASVAEATAADYAWLNDHWLREAFCITLVRELDQVEVLRRVGAEHSRPRTLTAAEAGELSGSFQAGYPQLVLVARADGWSVAVEGNGWEGSRLEVLRALSGGTQAVSVYRNVEALGYFNYAVDGQVLVSFELLFPQRRWGSQPDLLLPQMRAVDLDPDRHQPSYDDVVISALALAERVTGVHLDPGMLEGRLVGGEIAPLLDDPPASFFLGADDAELAAAIDQAAPGVLRRAAATAARHAVQLAQLDDPVVVEALAVAEAGQARQVDDPSPLGWRIRTWAVEVRVAERVRNDPRASLDAQQREASLLRAAGRPAERPPKDPSPWLGRGWTALVLRWRAGQAVRAALFGDPRTAIYATLEQLRYLPGDPWLGIRAAALKVLRSGGVAGPPGATDR
jgi:Family of unknown function (DUF6461)